MSKRNLIPDLNQLSVEERLELIEVVWDSLEDKATDVPVPDWHKLLSMSGSMHSTRELQSARH